MAQTPLLPDRYRPTRPVGEGATGYVWHADDLLLNIPVAVKVVRPNLAQYARFRARFAREVALSAQVVHRRLVPVYDHGRLFDGRPFAVMGYADQGSLAHLLRWGPPLQEVLRIMDQVLEALAALHAQGLVHQDLKPANVLLYTSNPGGAGGGSAAEAEIDAWVSDLGVAGTFSELAMDRKGISGTPTWMAPEQLMGRPQELGPWTDLYALGLILHEILGGERTPETIGRKELIKRRLAPVEPLADVPASVFQVIEKLLDPDPRQRYDRAADVRRALRDALRRLEGERLALNSRAGMASGTTTFPVTMLPEAQEALSHPLAPPDTSGAAPRWNRVPPDPLPASPLDVAEEFPERASLALFALRDPPLAGRQDLRRFLWQKAREVVRSGEPQVILVVGPSGSGKTRLVESLAVTLEEGGYMESVRLRYHAPAGADDGYRGAVRELLAPWNDTREQIEQRLQRWLARDHQVSPDSTAREAAVLARWCGYLSPGELPVNAAVGLAFLYRHLDAHAWRGGACLLLEDAHLARAEGDGLAICEALLERSVGQRPVLAMVTLASEALAADSHLAAKVAALEARGASRLTAARMTPAEMREMMGQALRMSPDLADAVSPVCQGSPATAALLLRDWSARGLLEQGRDMRIRLRPDARLEQVLPSNLEALCESRIQAAIEASASPLSTSEALAAAALAGQEPPVSLVRAINPEGLDSLFASGMLRQRGWRLYFEHGGVLEAARRLAQQRPDLAALHRRLAEAWAELGERTGADVDLPFGEHSLHAGEAGRAIPPLLRAARVAREEGRAALSLDAARLAIAAADRSGALAGRVEARQQAASALLDLDQAQEALDVLEDARKLGHLDRRTLARLRLLEARATIALGRVEEGRRCLEAAETVFESTRDREGLVDTAHGKGRLYRMSGQPLAAADCYRRMLQLDSDNPLTLVHALTGLVESLVSAGQLQGTVQHVDRLRRVARESGDTRNIARSTYAAGLVHLRQDRLEEAERHFQTARALAATLGSDRLQIACLNRLGELYRQRGDVRGAERFCRRAVRFAEERGWGSAAAVACLELALLHLQGQSDRLARAQVDQADRLLSPYPHHWAWMFVGLIRALWAAEETDEKACRSWWAVSVERGVGRLRRPDMWLPLERLARAAERAGWPDIASRAAALARGVAVEGPLIYGEEEEEE